MKEGSDKPLKAYATPGKIKVIATFVAELFISKDRPCFIEKFYAIEKHDHFWDEVLRYATLF